MRMLDEVVLFHNPTALVLFLSALVLCILDRIFCKSRGIVTVISAFIVMTAVALDLVSGAALRECAAFLIVFLLLNMEVKHEL